MIDTTHEHLMTLGEVAKSYDVHVGTVYRWTTDGFRGVRLEALQVGRSRRTSREALQRFLEAIVGRDARKQSAANGPRTASDAGEELTRYGI